MFSPSDNFAYNESDFFTDKTIVLDSKNLDFFKKNNKESSNIIYKKILDIYKNINFEKSFSLDKNRQINIYLQII